MRKLVFLTLLSFCFSAAIAQSQSGDAGATQSSPPPPAASSQSSSATSSSPSSTSIAPAGSGQDSAQPSSQDRKAQEQERKAQEKKDKKARKEQEKKARQEKAKQESDAKKAKKDNNKTDGGQDVIDTSSVFNERIANDVLGMIRDGLEGHSRRMMLSAFDSDKMDGYLSFEDQIDAFFNHYEAFRVHFRIANVAVEGSKGVVLVDAEMEESPAGAGAAPVRKRSQLRFELEMGRKGWRVVDVRDRSFFS